MYAPLGVGVYECVREPFLCWWCMIIYTFLFLHYWIANMENMKIAHKWATIQFGSKSSSAIAADVFCSCTKIVAVEILCRCVYAVFWLPFKLYIARSTIVTCSLKYTQSIDYNHSMNRWDFFLNSDFIYSIRFAWNLFFSLPLSIHSFNKYVENGTVGF